MEIAECRVENTAFRVIVSNDWERNRVDTLATKEPETVRWILDNFGPGDTLFDIGANIGLYAILAAVHNPAGKVIAVEPMAATFARLCENSALNGLQNLHPYCVAVSSENGLGTLNLASLDAASSMHSVGASEMTESFGEQVVIRTGIGLATIDRLAACTGVPSLIKIDVDGGEDAVLAGAAGVLHDPRLRSMLTEFNWIDGSGQKSRRDHPLLQAGFRPEVEGIEYARGSVRWQNTIYTRRT
jgi:FkbM family methyltransferase